MNPNELKKAAVKYAIEQSKRPGRTLRESIQKAYSDGYYDGVIDMHPELKVEVYKIAWRHGAALPAEDLHNQLILIITDTQAAIITRWNATNKYYEKDIVNSMNDVVFPDEVEQWVSITDLIKS